jgi:hypothetical protein
MEFRGRGANGPGARVSSPVSSPAASNDNGALVRFAAGPSFGSWGAVIWSNIAAGEDTRAPCAFLAPSRDDNPQGAWLNSKPHRQMADILAFHMKRNVVGRVEAYVV